MSPAPSFRNQFSQWLSRVVYTLLIIFIVLSVIITALTGTTIGSQWVLNSIIKNNPAVKVGNVNGTLLYGLIINNIDYQSEQNQLSIDELNANWEPLALLSGVFQISHVHARKIHWIKNNSTIPANEQSQKLWLELPLPIQLLNVKLGQIKLNINGTEHKVDSVNVRALINNNTLSLKQLNINSPFAALSGYGFINNTKPYHLKFDIDWRHSDHQDKLYSGSANLSGHLSSINIQHKLLQPYTIHTSGTLHLQAQPKLVSNSFIKQLQWPNKGNQAPATLKEINMHLEGWLNHFTIQATSNLDVAAIKNAKLHLNMTGNTNSVQITKLDITSPDQPLNVQATADINLLPKLSVKTQTKLNFAENSLSLNAHIDDNISLQWQLNAPALQSFLPTLKGELNSHGTINGTLKSPKIKGVLRANQFQYGIGSIEKANIIATYDNKHHNRINITGQNIYLGGQNFDQLNLNINGDIHQHQIQAALSHALGQIQLVAAGAYQNSIWQGSINHGSLNILETKQWQLDQTASIQISSQALTLEQHCWKLAQAAFCLQLHTDKMNGIKANGQLNHLPLGIFNPYLQPQSQLAGILNANISIYGFPDALKTHAELNSPSGSLLSKDRNNSEIKHYWNNIQFTLNGRDDKSWMLTAAAKLQDNGSFNGNLNISPKRQLQGLASINFTSLDWLSPFIPIIEQTTGQLRAEAKISGNIEQPKITLNARLQDGNTTIPALGIRLKDVDIKALSDDKNHIRLIANAKSDQGYIYTTGIINKPFSDDWEIQLNTNGQSFQWIGQPELNATINPELTFHIKPWQLNIQGDATIPSADIKINAPAIAAADISPDAVEITADQTHHQDRQIELTHRIRLLSGDAIMFQGFGLNCHLNGEVQIEKKAGQLTQAFGELYLLNGNYKAYGTKLTVEEGSKLIFQGSLNNPALSIRATRKAENIIAGLELAGTLKKPQSRLFSIPSLPETEIAAVLVTGKPLSSASKTDANAIINAITSWGLERSGNLTQYISNKFKLDVVTIENPDNYEQSSVLIGKYLTPRLLIKYTIGLFKQNNTLGMEYQINEKLKLETESGKQRSADLFYNIER